MHTGREKFVRIVEKIILAITLLFSLCIISGTVYIGEQNLFTDMFSPVMRVLLLLILCGTLFLFLEFVYSLLDKCTHRQLVLVSVICFVLMAGIFVLVLFFFRSTPFSDALNVQDLALYFAETGTDKISESAPHYSYFTDIGNNNFTVILFSLIDRLLLRLGISDTILPLKILSAAGILLSALFTFLITVRIGNLRKGTKVLILCVMNPLYYLLILWVYTNVISIPFMLAVLYFAVCAWKAKGEGKRILYCSLTICSAVIGYYIRATVLIPFIALICCALLLLIRGRKMIRRYARSSVIAVLIGILLFNGIGALNNSYFSSVSEGYLPVTHWLMMGSHGSGTHNQSDMSYTRSFDTAAEKREATIQKTIENYRSSTLPDLALLMGKKIVRNWSYGTGGDLFNKVSQEEESSIFYSWVLGERSDLFKLYCYAIWLLTFLGIIFSLIRMLKSPEILHTSFLFALTLFGAFIFYLFWEVKSSYALPFIYIMYTLTEDGLEPMKKKEEALSDRPHRKARIFTFAAVTICLIFVFSFSYEKMSQTIITLKDWNIHCSSNQKSTGKISSDGSLLLRQEFSASKPFDTIVLGARADEDALKENARYQIRLEDEEGRELYSQEICAEDISKNKISIKTGEIIPEGDENYTVTIQSGDSNENQVRFLQIGNYYLDIYPGTLSVNGKERQNDLWLQVYEEYKSVWASKKISVIINAGWGLILIALLYRALLKGKSDESHI